ncbi:NUDIX domain-containing protein [Exiguobacterium sp. s192]|uniref:NUDIX domain-containing protein n=1 Tax=Exiguobacterium sp. s192 TaxID=2751206 RepID=UPI001BE89E50|nr:NUDIX domain-containing protein [Exiguobacterium sp. s192]
MNHIMELRKLVYTRPLVIPGACELFEETGLTAKHLQLLNVYSGNDFYYKYPHGDKVYNVISAYVCREYRGTLIQDVEEVAALKFFRLDNVPGRINPPEHPILLEFIASHQS